MNNNALAKRVFHGKMTRRDFLWLATLSAAGTLAGCAINPVTGEKQLMLMSEPQEIDIDKKSGGYETWDLLQTVNPEPFETVLVSTGNGGQHHWFFYPDSFDIRSGAGVLGKGVDIRANGGYVLIPPSKTSTQYQFEISPETVIS